MKLISVTTEKGLSVLINIQFIVAILNDETHQQASVLTSTGVLYTVKESKKLILQQIQELQDL